MSATLSIEISAGSSIERAAEDAQRIADILRVNVEFSFNEVRCLAVPGGMPDVLAERQQQEQARKLTNPRDTRFASSRINVGHVIAKAKATGAA